MSVKHIHINILLKSSLLTQIENNVRNIFTQNAENIRDILEI